MTKKGTIIVQFDTDQENSTILANLFDEVDRTI
jgi:hypothetical protein